MFQTFFSKKGILGVLLYLLLGLGLGWFLAHGLAKDDVGINTVCKTYQSCFSSYAYIIPSGMIAWPIFALMGFINFDFSSVIFLSGLVVIGVFIRFFPAGASGATKLSSKV